MIKMTVLGIYETADQAERGVDILLADGFANEDISILLQDYCGVGPDEPAGATKALVGAKVGVATGSAVGGTLGLLAALGALAIPGATPVIAAGPLVATAGGVGFGAVVGGFLGGIAGMGIPDDEAKRTEIRINEGRVLLSVRCDAVDEVARAKKLLRKTGALDISSSGETGGCYPAAESSRRAGSAGLDSPLVKNPERLG